MEEEHEALVGLSLKERLRGALSELNERVDSSASLFDLFLSQTKKR